MRTLTKLLTILICIVLVLGGVAPALAVNTSGYTVAIPCVFEDGSVFFGGMAPVKNNGKYGLIDKAGNVIAPFVYDSFSGHYSSGSDEIQSSYFVAIQNEKWGVIDKSGRPVVPCKYDGIWNGGNGLAIVGIGNWVPPGPPNLDGLWGLVDLRTGREILPVKYKRIFPSDDFSLFAVDLKNTSGVIDRSGKFTVPLGKYDYIMYPLNSELILASNNGKFGIIDKSGKVINPFVYSEIGTFWNGIAYAIKGSKFGVINVSGKIVVPFQYDAGEVLINGASYMIQRDKITIFDKTGKVIASAGKYDGVIDVARIHFSGTYHSGNIDGGNLIYVERGGKFGAIDTTGKEIISPKYDSIEGIAGNLIYVQRGGKIGAIDITGQEIVPLIYTGIREIMNGLAVVIDNDKCTVINQSGKAILPLDKYGGTLDENGTLGGYGIIILDDGCVQILSTESKWGLIDYNGNTILPCEYESIGNMNDGYVAVQNEKGYALFNKDGQIIVPFGDFESIGNINENMASVTKDGLTGFISLPEYIAPPDGWAKPEVDRAIAAGLVPEDMCRKYQDNIIRADFCRLAVNLIEVKTGMKVDVFMKTRGMSDRVSDPIVFTDTGDPYVIAASSLGIVNGVGNNKFDPTGKIKRQDAAVMLKRTAEVLDFTEPNGTPEVFADSDKFSGYAADAIDFVSAAADKESGNKVMGGTGNNNFSPLDTYTRQQAYMTILRIYNAMR